MENGLNTVPLKCMIFSTIPFGQLIILRPCTGNPSSLHDACPSVSKVYNHADGGSDQESIASRTFVAYHERPDVRYAILPSLVLS